MARKPNSKAKATATATATTVEPVTAAPVAEEVAIPVETAPVETAEKSETAETAEPAAAEASLADDAVAAVVAPQEPEAPARLPVVVVATARGVASRRRAGFVFSREPVGIALDALTPEQLAALKADPCLVVEAGEIDSDEAEQ